MDQTIIIDALQKALAKGSGSLDDLDSLLKRAQADVARAKEEEKAAREAAAKKRGQEIADLANRLLENKITDDDCAFVMNTWLAAKGYAGALFTGADLKEMFVKGETAAKEDYINTSLEKALNDLVNDIGEWSKTWKNTYNNKKPAPKAESADEVIDNFLKSFGLK